MWEEWEKTVPTEPVSCFVQDLQHQGKFEQASIPPETGFVRHILYKLGRENTGSRYLPKHCWWYRIGSVSVRPIKKNETLITFFLLKFIYGINFVDYMEALMRDS